MKKIDLDHKPDVFRGSYLWEMLDDVDLNSAHPDRIVTIEELQDYRAKIAGINGGEPVQGSLERTLEIIDEIIAIVNKMDIPLPPDTQAHLLDDAWKVRHQAYATSPSTQDAWLVQAHNAARQSGYSGAEETTLVNLAVFIDKLLRRAPAALQPDGVVGKAAEDRAISAEEERQILTESFDEARRYEAIPRTDGQYGEDPSIVADTFVRFAKTLTFAPQVRDKPDPDAKAIIARRSHLFGLIISKTTIAEDLVERLRGPDKVGANATVRAIVGANRQLYKQEDLGGLVPAFGEKNVPAGVAREGVLGWGSDKAYVAKQILRMLDDSELAALEPSTQAYLILALQRTVDYRETFGVGPIDVGAGPHTLFAPAWPVNEDTRLTWNIVRAQPLNSETKVLAEKLIAQAPRLKWAWNDAGTSILGIQQKLDEET